MLSLFTRTLGLLLATALFASCQNPSVSHPGDQVKLDVAWKVPLDSDPLEVQLIEGNTMYVTETFGLVSIDLDTGRVNWRSSLPQTLLVVGGAYAWGDYLVAPSTMPLDSIPLFFDRLAYWDKSGHYLGSEQLPNSYIWNYSPGGVGARLLLPSFKGYHSYELNPHFGKAKLRPATPGPDLEVAAPPAFEGRPNSWQAGGRPEVYGTTLLVALQPKLNGWAANTPPGSTDTNNDPPGRIMAFDSQSFLPLWTLENTRLWPFGGAARLAFKRMGDNVFYADAGGYVYFRFADGKVLWETLDQGATFKSIGASTYYLEGNSIYETTLSSADRNEQDPTNVIPSVARLTFEPSTYPEVRSQLVWGLDVAGLEQLQSNPVVHNGVLYALSEEASLVVDAETGKLYGRDPELYTSPFASQQSTWKHNDLWIVVTADNNLTAVRMNFHVGLDGKLYK